MRCFVAGGTGLVGGELLKLLRADPALEIVNLVRRPLDDDAEARLVDFARQELPAGLGSCDVGFCSLGTTIKKAGSREAFARVDHDFVLNFAHWCKQAGARSFVLVTSLGADPASVIFYNQVKGRIEQAVRALGFARLVVLQPSVLDGERQESRLGEAIGLGLLRGLRPLLVGPLRPFRVSPAHEVARVMKELASGADEPFRVVPSVEIARIAEHRAAGD